ncbi:MAG: hypothetical protein AMXMBFR56_62090 [Polyangiaceae bacterium]
MTETSAKIIADSISPAGHRFTTFEVVYPRIVLAEVNTHRQLSKVSASSRAVPVEKMIRRVLEDPYVPTHWGKNQKGMRAEEDVDAETAQKAVAVWLKIRDQVVLGVRELLELGIHKQITNRWLETAQWHPTVISGTEFSNFFHLRDHVAAHPDFRDLAHGMREVYGKSEPKQLSYMDWHMPYIGDADYETLILDAPENPSAVLDTLRKVSVGRCARVSSLTHEGKYDLPTDVGLHDKMLVGGHMSPYENVARPMTPDELELFKQKKMRWDPVHECWYWVGAKYKKLSRPGSRLDHTIPLIECDSDDPAAMLMEEGEYTHFLGNVQGWVTLRKMIPYEEDILGARS